VYLLVFQLLQFVVAVILVAVYFVMLNGWLVFSFVMSQRENIITLTRIAVSDQKTPWLNILCNTNGE